MLNRMSGHMPQKMSERISHDMSDRNCRNNVERYVKELSEDMPETML